MLWCDGSLPVCARFPGTSVAARRANAPDHAHVRDRANEPSRALRITIDGLRLDVQAHCLPMPDAQGIRTKPKALSAAELAQLAAKCWPTSPSRANTSTRRCRRSSGASGSARGLASNSTVSSIAPDRQQRRPGAATGGGQLATGLPTLGTLRPTKEDCGYRPTRFIFWTIDFTQAFWV